MRRTKNYIPSPEYHKDCWAYPAYPNLFERIDKYPIDKIKFNKKFLSIPNPVYQQNVKEIVEEFHIEGWEPIFLNEKGYLIDGQHRLAAAKQMNLKYIDVIQINDK